tara:strand:- start:1019 stop:1873 length:855 start_codon:yes stop_codon:yes gene_type:complete
MKQILTICLFIFSVVLYSQNNQLVEIETKDGNIFLGTIIKESDEGIILKTQDGIRISVPNSSIKNLSKIETTEVEGQVWRADPNKSMYLFAPSAFPIEKQKVYCRDFCLVFPSYNRGFGNNFSLQAGAFVFPGMQFDNIPIVLSGKFSLPELGPARLATGMMYISVPGQSTSFGAGFAFGSATIGNRFTHFTASLGWGYFRDENEWDFAEKPILVLASNIRVLNSFAVVAEYWLPPEVDDPTNLPIALSGRFIGRRFAVDIGGFFTKDMEGIPLPLINFTYHLK